MSIPLSLGRSRVTLGNRIAVILGFVAITLSLAACHSHDPDCASEATKRLVLQIAKDNNLARPWAVPDIKYALAMIRTTKKDRDTKRVSCATKLKFTSEKLGYDSSREITYTVEYTSDDELYATILDME
jgi:hypothetical protein